MLKEKTVNNGKKSVKRKFLRFERKKKHCFFVQEATQTHTHTHVYN